MYGGQSTHIPMKVLMAGVMPVIFASTLLAIPQTLAFFFPNMAGGVQKYFSVAGSPGIYIYTTLNVLLIIFFTYFYTCLLYTSRLGRGTATGQGKKLVINVGLSHPVEMEDPKGIETEVEGTNKIIVKGIDKQQVGNYAAIIRDWRRPEPYKGKGIKYSDEVVRRKAGKTGN